MRIYEYAKKHNTTSKNILSVLKEGGFEFKSHMALITPEALGFLDKKFIKSTTRADSRPQQEQSKTMQKVKPKQKTTKPLQPGRGPLPKEGKEAPVVREKKNGQERARFQEPKKIIVRPMSLADAAKEMGKPATGVILTLLKWGVVANLNQVLPEELVKRLALQYGIEVEEAKRKDVAISPEREAPEDSQALQPRFPVVVVMGHVDHGKTTLLDFIRKARVAAKEKGGITQHLGAYEVKTPGGGIVFLDTPGHEAFSKIRMRGARAADIAVLVIAADDGIMPQTVESINHAKSMGLPIVVAINKVDKASSSQIEAVKHGLSRYDLLPEDWGGDVICVPISAKLGQGIDSLLEMIILQAQIMELKADKEVPARGHVLESKIEKGRGPVATLICQHGTAKVGDFFVCGNTFGKINSMINSYGQRVRVAEPSIPVLVAGFDSLPEAGDFFEVVSAQEHRKARLGKRERKPSVSELLAVGSKEDINMIIKADSDSSKEALLWAIESLSSKLEKGFNVVQASVGNISESDIELASISGSIVVGLHVKLEAKASLLAQRVAVKVDLFDIIYKLIDFLKEYAEGKKEVKKEFKKIGEAVVLRVFKIKKIGVIAGCIVKDGRFIKNGTVFAWRGDTKVGEGKIISLQREKKTVKEAHAGFECGFVVDGFDEWEVDDRVECYAEVTEENK